MSFLLELQKKKNKLKKTLTVVKTTDGGVYKERMDEGSVVTLEKVGVSEGYVVDVKPDLQVGAVLPGLLVGSQDVTQSEELLQCYRVTHIISVGVQVAQLPSYNYTFIDVLDVPEFNMRPVFDQCCSLIDSIRNAGGVVLVHCNAGVSRSAAIVIAYLMKVNKLSYSEAFEAVKKERPCIKPNEGFVKQLKALER